MKKILSLVFVLMIVCSCQEKESALTPKADGPKEKAAIVRMPAVAEKFYPGDPKELERTVDGFLTSAQRSQTTGMITALILPHAGYEYSGQVAAFGFKELVGEDIDTVILIGNSHQLRFDGVSIYPEGK